MTPEELCARENIRQTMANYTIAGDRLRADDFVAAFTEDGVMESEGVAEADAFRYEGRADLRNWITRWRHPAAGAPTHQASFVRHHLATCQIDFIDAKTAKARTYWVAYTDIGADHGGVYLDLFRKTGETWLIAHRKVRMDWRAPNSLFTTAITRSR
jgi:3-phenylpropionate/cinnamic acid dioxygenase small subunit